MLFRQLFDPVSSTYSYLLAQRPGGEALLVDPVLDRVPQYLQLVHELDCHANWGFFLFTASKKRGGKQ